MKVVDYQDKDVYLGIAELRELMNKQQNMYSENVYS